MIKIDSHHDSVKLFCRQVDEMTGDVEAGAGPGWQLLFVFTLDHLSRLS
jgi:hypothetical protein